MPQGAPADAVQPAPDAVLQRLVTQQDRRCQGQPEVLGGIMGVLTPWQGQRRDSSEQTFLGEAKRQCRELRTRALVGPTHFPTLSSWLLGELLPHFTVDPDR